MLILLPFLNLQVTAIKKIENFRSFIFCWAQENAY